MRQPTVLASRSRPVCATRSDARSRVPRGEAESHVKPNVEEGRLVYVLDGDVGAAAPLSLIYVDREYQAPQARASIERAVECFLGPKQ